MSFLIREAGEADVALLTVIIRQSFATVAREMGLTPENCPRHPSNCAEDWVAEALAKGTTYWVLEDGGDPAGCVALEDAGEGVGYLERLAVLPSFRHRGHGRSLVEHVLSEAARRGMARISIGIIAGQTVLRDWYLALGFEEGETKVFDHLPFDVLFMSAKLPQHNDRQRQD
jgi:N-acetylglutamate synthase-like GNAT family acetyltransferase